MIYNIGRASFYPKLNLIKIDNKEITLDFNESIIINHLIENANKFTTINKIKRTCLPGNCNTVYTVKKTINNIKNLINSYNNNNTVLISFFGIVYLKSSADSGDGRLAKNCCLILSLIFMFFSLSFIYYAPKREYVDKSIDIYKIKSNHHVVNIFNNVHNKINMSFIEHLKSINEDLKIFYFESSQGITFSIINKNKSKSYVINKSDEKLLCKELDKVLKS